MTKLFAEAGLRPTKYQPEVIYPEPEFQALFRGAQAVFGVDAVPAEKAFSKYFMHVSPKMFPAIFRHAKNARQMLEKIPSIHRNFPSAASQGAYQDKVFITESTPGEARHRVRLAQPAVRDAPDRREHRPRALR